jgi:hypothetical protein
LRVQAAFPDLSRPCVDHGNAVVILWIFMIFMDLHRFSMVFHENL